MDSLTLEGLASPTAVVSGVQAREEVEAASRSLGGFLMISELLTLSVEVGSALIKNEDPFGCGTNFLPLFLTKMR